MLKFFRKKTIAKMVLWGLLILILPAFVLWGVGSLGKSGKRGPSFVGIACGKKVSFDDFGRSLLGARCQIILNYFNQPQTLDTLLNNKSFLGRIAWDRVILAREAKRHMIKVPDADVVNFIRSHPLFLRNDQFDERIYAYFLKHNAGLDPRNFEEIIRENLSIQKLNDILTKDIKVTDEEVLEAYRKDAEKFKLSCVLWTADAFLKNTKVDDSQAKEYYDKYKNEFIIPSNDPKEAPRTANFEDVKESIKSFLAESQAKTLASIRAEEDYEKIKDAMRAQGQTFEAACAKLGLKIQETPLFSKSDYLEGIGEASQLISIAVKLKKDEISEPIKVRKGALIFRVIETQKFDEERFKKEKADYLKKALAEKKNQFLEILMTKLESESTLNIDLKDYEKYYR